MSFKKLQAVLFDQDGVIIDTERDGHRVAFNEAFKDFEFNVEWDIETYGELLQIAGGKERALHYLQTSGFGEYIPSKFQKRLVESLHIRKTEIFVDLIRSKSFSLRPGIKRLMTELVENGVSICICTTSKKDTTTEIIKNYLPDIPFHSILAGDVVKKKKPSPDIYELALEKLGVNNGSCVVIEDSHIGVEAAKAAGLPVIATTSTYTVNEDLTKADLVISSLGDPGHPAEVIFSKSEFSFDGMLTLNSLKRYLEFSGG